MIWNLDEDNGLTAVQLLVRNTVLNKTYHRIDTNADGTVSDYIINTIVDPLDRQIWYRFREILSNRVFNEIL